MTDQPLQYTEVAREQADAVGTERETELARLVVQLAEGTTEERRKSARRLRKHGSDAVMPLCAALQATDEELRLDAARSLGSLGDARAVEPLIMALRAGCLGGSVENQRRAGITFIAKAVGVTILACILMELIFHKTNPVVWCYFGLGSAFSAWAAGRVRRGRHLQTLTRALEQIAEANPTPALREVLPELKELAGDALQQDNETRQVLRSAVGRIDTLTKELRSLPIAAAAPEPEVATLPVAVGEHQTEAAALPRVTS